jgi:poly-gamma-glutamate synthesis protein (capsule biosynthesis protein)
VGLALRRGLSAFAALVLLGAVLSVDAGPRPVTLALLGDVSLGRSVHAQEASLASLRPALSSADLSLANLESPLGLAGEGVQPAAVGSMNLCASAASAPLLAGWGLDLLTLANNHRLDCPGQGVAATRAALEGAGLLALGDGAEGGVVYRTVGGLRLALLAFDDVSTPLDLDAAAERVRAARQTGALVIVSMHWGSEYQSAPSPRQRTIAERLAAAGAALIWGHHPHVLQPAEWIETPAGRALVLYSLGNALFDQHGLADTRRSALLQVTLTAQGVRSVEALPFAIDVRASRVTPPTAEDTQAILQRLDLR